MFWRRGVYEHTVVPGEPVDSSNTRAMFGPIEVSPEISRPAAILRVAGELERRGNEIVELFEELEVAGSRLVVPIHYRHDEEDCFAEVETEPWDTAVTEKVLAVAAALRASPYSGSRLDLYSAHPVPREVSFLIGSSCAALLQLDLLGTEASDPESLAESFRATAETHWRTELDYGTECLPLAEELILTALKEDEESGETAFVTGALVKGLGCYLGEIVRRNSPMPGTWQPASDWGEEYILDFDLITVDPLGKARAFLNQGKGDSISYYVGYVLEALGGPGEGATGAGRQV